MQTDNTIFAVILAVISSVAGSSGIWAYMMKKADKRDLKTRMLIGLGHDRIIELCVKYLERGYITPDELENLIDYLYKPYSELGGNGSAERLVNKVQNLEVHEHPIAKEDTA